MTPAAPSPLPAFGALWFCYFAAIGAFNPYAPLWFKDLGFSTLAIGTIASLQAWTRVVAPYGWGWLGDHHGHRARVVQVAAGLSMLAAAGLLAARGFGAVAACIVLLYLANGGVMPLSEATLARHLSRGGALDAGRYGRVRVWGSIGFIVAVLVFGLGLERAGIGWFPWLAAAMWALLLVVALRLPEAGDAAGASGQTTSAIAVLRQPAVAWFFASIFFTVLAHTALYAFFSLHLDASGFGKTTVGLLWAVSVAAEIVFFWFQGRLFGRLDPHAWLQWAAAGAVLRFVLTALFGTSLVVLVVAQAMHALTFAAQHAACIALVTRHFPGALRTRGQALYSVLGYGLSGVIGGVGGGWLSLRWGYAAVFGAAAVAAAVGWFCATRARRLYGAAGLH